MKIAITGSAGTGKTALAEALAEELKLPLVPEEMREHLQQPGARRFSELASTEAAAQLRTLWHLRQQREAAHAEFIADNATGDFAAYALHHGCAADAPELLREPLLALEGYDAIFVLPHGAIPYQRDGVRHDDPTHEQRYQLILEGLLRPHARKLHFLPAKACTLVERLAYVRTALQISRPAKPGTVYLVGAGPGDPGLLTVRARELLESVEVVAHDELIAPALLALAHRRAELLPVGRRRGDGPISYRLHPAVRQRAEAGHSVLRLKQGDPLIFGRGGEEAQELREAGIPFELVPGISAALGAAASARIPLTHRHCSSDVTLVSGHDAEGAHRSSSRWPAVATGKGTVVLYMGSRHLAANLVRLREAGHGPDTPCAYVAAATTPREQIVTGTLATLETRVAAAAVDPTLPALVICGEVVRLREELHR
jgi:uroporphyrin-III C-methyltransferase